MSPPLANGVVLDGCYGTFLVVGAVAVWSKRVVLLPVGFLTGWEFILVFRSWDALVF